MTTIAPLTEVSENIRTALNGLVGELRHETASAGTFEDLKRMVESDSVVVMLAKDGETILGMALLIIGQKLGKRIGFVEDVVVSEAARGQGLGKGLMHALIEEAKKRSCTYLFLTSKPDKVAANALYQKLGFQLKETNCYQLPL